MANKKVILKDGSNNDTLLPNVERDNIRTKYGSIWETNGFYVVDNLPPFAYEEYLKHKFYLYKNEMYFMTWSEYIINEVNVPNIPVAVNRPSFGVDNRYIYVVSKDLYVFDTYSLTESWTTKTLKTKVSPTLSSGNTLIGDNLFVLEKPGADYKINVKTNAVTPISPNFNWQYPYRNNIAVDKKIYSFFPENNLGSSSPFIFIYDTENEAVEKIDIKAISCKGLCDLDNIIYIIDYKSVYKFNTTSKELTKMLDTTFKLRSCYVQRNKVYVVSIDGDIYELNISNNTLKKLEGAGLTKDSVSFFPTTNGSTLRIGGFSSTNTVTLINNKKKPKWFKLTAVKAQ